MIYKYTVIEEKDKTKVPILNLSSEFQIGKKLYRGYIFLDYMLYQKHLKTVTGFYHDNDPKQFFLLLSEWINTFNEGCRKGWFFWKRGVMIPDLKNRKIVGSGLVEVDHTVDENDSRIILVEVFEKIREEM